MALVLADRIKETTTTTGTGTVTLLGASTGFQSFAVIGNANTTYYAIVAQTGTEWEVGIGTYTLAGTLLARTTVLSNSSGTQPSALSFSAGTKDVFVTYPSSKSVNLDASGNAVFPAGTVSLPAITTTGDTNTGIFFPAADTIAFAEGGAESMRIDSSGNVGIGTSAPVTKLNLIDALAGGQLLVATNQTNATEKYGTFGTQHYTNAEEPALGIAAQSNATDNIILVGGALSEFNAATQVRFYTAANNTTVTGTERMRIDSSGNVGVGTTTPVAQLGVYGTGQTTAAMSTSTGLGGMLYARDSGSAANNGGAVMFGANQGAFATIKGLLQDGATNTRGDLAFSTRNAVADATLTERMRITSAGNVGIGTASPTTKLDVTGTITASVSVITSGATGKVVTAIDAGGNISLGRVDGVASTPFLDFNSGATAVDYDVRVQASGGNGTAGNGTLTITGALVAPSVTASNGLVVNSNTVSASYSIPSGSSAMSAGPMSVSGGVVVTVPSGSRWVVL
jgi:hypothetical protein